MSGALDFDTLADLSGGRFGAIDITCPICSHHRRRINQRKKVMRVWRDSDDFLSYKCIHCLAEGYATDGTAHRQSQPDPIRQMAARQRAAEHQSEYAAAQLGKARWFWRASEAAPETPTYTYLRVARGITRPLPATVRFLSPRKPGHHPAMLVPYGIPDEPDPGVLDIAEARITAVHLTFLKPDGSGKADVEPNKITVGSPRGMPLVLAPPNDLLGLAITEGAEDALTVHQATGLGAWAAGSAAFMPATAAAVPDYMEAVTIYAHPDESGQRGAYSLAEKLQQRGIEVRVEGIAA